MLTYVEVVQSEKSHCLAGSSARARPAQEGAPPKNLSRRIVKAIPFNFRCSRCPAHCFTRAGRARVLDSSRPWFPKLMWLFQRVAYSLAGQIEIFLIDLDTDEFLIQSDCRDSGTAAAHERV
jgi:hypothetical protein